MKQKYQLAFVILTLVFLIGLAITDDFEQEQHQYNHYCEMVEIWESNKHLPAEQRPGWPLYNGECDGQD